MKINIFIALLILSISAKAQILKNSIFNNENSATTENKMNIAKKNIDHAYKAYSEKKLDKFKYYVDQSQREGVKDGDFYFLLGVFMYETEEFKAAKRYWKIAFKEGGCWQCKELLEKLKNKESLQSIIDKKIELYLNETN